MTAESRENTGDLYSDAEVYISVGAAILARYDGTSLDLKDVITGPVKGDVVVEGYSGAPALVTVDEEYRDFAHLVLRPVTKTAEKLVDDISENVYYDDFGLLYDLVFEEPQQE